MAKRKRRRRVGRGGPLVRVERRYIQPAYRRANSAIARYPRAQAVRETGVQYLLVGVAAAWLLDTKTVQEWLGKWVWGVPAVIILLGFWARKRGSRYAGALLILGGLLAFQQWKKSREKKDTTKGPMVLRQLPDGSWTTDDETGALPGNSRWTDDDSAARHAAAVFV